MWLLLKTALRYRKNYGLLFITLLSMVSLSLANPLEVASIGIITGTGSGYEVDFFQLFQQESDRSTDLKEPRVKREALERVWPLIDKEGRGEIRKSDATDYLAKQGKQDFFHLMVAQVSRWFGFSQSVWHIVLFLVTVALVKAIALFTQSYTTALVAIRISQQMRQDYFDHIQSLPMSFYNDHHIGALSTRVSGDAGAIAHAINSLLINYFQTPLTLLCSLFMLYQVSPPLFTLTFVALPVLVVPIVVLTKRVKRLSMQMQTRKEQFSQVLYEFLAGIQTIKSYAMEAFSSERYNACNQHVVSLEMKSSRYALLLRPILHFLVTLVLSFVILWGFYVAKINLSQILLFCGILYLAYEPVKKFAEENARIQVGVAAAQRLYQVLERKSDITDRLDALSLPAFERSIEFRDVWFRYQPDQEWVLQGFNLKISKGQFVALVGPTGSGKSTLVQLLLRLYEVQKGSILIDGHDLRDLKQDSLRASMAYVPQKPFLFLDTVAANVAFGKPLEIERVERACRRAMASEFIEQLVQGYDTPLREGGKDLSGGQQQRLAIARALYREAPILILDEATSALDAVTEDRIKSILQDLRGEMTQLVIAHRLSTVESADKIVYIEQGRKIAEGSAGELVQICPSFQAMWHASKGSH